MAGRADRHSAAPVRRPVNRLGVRGFRRAAHSINSERGTGMRPNVRVLKSTEVVQVLGAAERRPAFDRHSPVYPHGLVLALGFSLVCWVVILAALYAVWG